MADIILDCERAMVSFNFVPDLFRLLTITMDIQTVEGIPILGTAKWPLDYFWNRTAKRLEDIAGALVGLFISAPFIVVAALLIKRSSPGPVFYRQERCGEKGRPFTIYKLRTMAVDAEQQSGPVWTVENDPRRTAVGSVLRAYNIDELPQFWNVLKGDMSLVGPRPERPHFVEQFKEDISRYMWRHSYRPGMTGWAQVNGLRGNTSIRERSKYDLYYLENWSLALDFKILARTLFTRTNAY
jgi:exopolysaccharide biosynthesis polyprenyl glycosylphosphotransferase